MGRTARIGWAVIIGVILFAFVTTMIVLAKNHGFDWHEIMYRLGIDFLFYEGTGTRRWTSRFKLMNGQLKKEIKVGRDQVVELSPVVSLAAGELEVIIVDPNGKEFYRKTYPKDEGKIGVLKLSEPGRWKIYVIGRSARGEFKFTWHYSASGPSG